MMRMTIPLICLYLLIICLQVPVKRNNSKNDSRLEHQHSLETKNTTVFLDYDKNETFNSMDVILLVVTLILLIAALSMAFSLIARNWCRAQRETNQGLIQPQSLQRGKSDELKNGKKNGVNFHRSIDTTFSNMAIDKISEKMKSGLIQPQSLQRGKSDESKNGKKNGVNFHRSIDTTFSNMAIDKISEKMKSVGLLFFNNLPMGTVIRIGQKFILTAWHVIEPIVSTPGRIGSNGEPKTSMNLQNLKNKDVLYVGFSKNAKSREPDCEVGMLPKLCFCDKVLDVCILELDCDSALLPAPFDDFRDFYAMWDSKTQSKFVHVIGQHPASKTIVLDPGCKVISKDDEKVNEIYKLLKKNKNKVARNISQNVDVKENYKNHFDSDKFLVIDTFLEFGASGGAVVSFTPDGVIALVGVLLRGLPSWYWNEKGVAQSYTNDIRVEVACSISSILKSKDWRDSEKRRIFGQNYIALEIEEDMETDDLERTAVDEKLAILSLSD